MAKDYWKDRKAKALTNLSSRSAKSIEAQLKKYYRQTMDRTIADFEATYDKLLATMEDGREPTPADLYKLDKYWQSQAQLKKELQRLGDKEAALFSRQFEDNFKNVYDMLARDSGAHYSRISTQGAQQMIKQVWAADGKSWSKRIWENTEDLAATLNEKLIECVVGGKKTSDLKKALMERFNVSFSRADALARTELAHIQTQAAKQRYTDTGIKRVQIWADKDERRCETCGKLHEKIYPVDAQIPIPAHPRCRCCIVPVVDIPDEIAEGMQPQEQPPQQEQAQQPQKIARRRDPRDRKPDFKSMDKQGLQEWSKANLATDIDLKGASLDASQAAIDLLYDLEKKGFDLQGRKIVFGNTGGMYGSYSPDTQTIYLRRTTDFVERMQNEDAKALRKLGKKQHAVGTYRGIMAHEIGHALDDISGKRLSLPIANSAELYKKAVGVSNYAGASAALGTNKASEAFAENFSLYMAGGDMPPEVRTLIDEYLEELKKKKRK